VQSRRYPSVVVIDSKPCRSVAETGVLSIVFHVVVIDGVFEPDPAQGVRFIAAQALDADAVRAVQTQVRRRILRAFARRGRIDAQTRKEMEAWDHGGGFSLDASVRIEADDRKGLERLLRYYARPPFAADRLEELDPQRRIRPRKSGDPPPASSGSWLLARIYEAFPLAIPTSRSRRSTNTTSGCPGKAAPLGCRPHRCPLSTTQPIAHQKNRLATPWRADFGRIGCQSCSDGASLC
jgi:hypothetical protein